MAVGDIYGEGKNSLVVITSEGFCHIFDIQATDYVKSSSDNTMSHTVSQESFEFSGHYHGSPNDNGSVEVFSTNVSATNSYDPESVISLDSDHPILDYSSPPTTYSTTLPKPIRSTSFGTNDEHSTDGRSFSTASKKRHTTPQRVEDKIQPSYRWHVVSNATCIMLGDIDETGKNELIIGSSDRLIYVYTIVDDLDEEGNTVKILKLKRKWRLPGQVISLSMFYDNWGRPVVLATQQEGCYTTIDHKSTMKFFKVGRKQSTEETFEVDPNGPSEIIYVRRSPLSKDGLPQDPVLFLISYMNGSIKMQEETGKILWEMQLDRQLFPIKALDFSQDGDQSVIISSWDGMTYVIDQRGNSIQAKFHDRIRAFTAGYFSPTETQTFPCLVYLTFSDQLIVYYNLAMQKIETQTVVSSMKNQIDEIQRLEEEVNNNEEWDVSLIRSLLQNPWLDEINLKEYIKVLNSHVQK